MTEPTSFRRTTVLASSTGRRRLAAAGVLCWALVVVAGLAPPAGAVESYGVVAPADGSTVDGVFELIARVQPEPGEVIDRVDGRLGGASERTVVLSTDGAIDADGTQTWRATIDPLDGLALANGPYGIAVRVVPLLGEPTAYDGHDLRLAVPPPTRALLAEPTAEDATAVDLRWESVALPDFIAYRIQRRSHASDGVWTTVRDLTDPREASATDRVDVPGEYRYRLIVVRADGRGGELFATSQPHGVRADPEDPGTFLAPPEPAPRPVGTPEPQPGEPSETPSPTPAPSDPGTTVRPPPGTVTVRPPIGGAEPPRAAPPSVVPFNDGVFEEALPFDDFPSEILVLESEPGFLEGDVREGGTLAVLTEAPGDRRLATATASGLLLIVIGAHVRRFMASGGRR
ncbi:hypothetical protein BH23ACT9_BH23ACT9_03460 [soil metagenome]